MNKKSITIISLIIVIYFFSVFIRAYNSEKYAEKYVVDAFLDFANPWSADKLSKRASWWLINKAEISPNEICRLAKIDLGNIIKVIKPPKCNIQQGIEKASSKKITYALCSAEFEFEKNNVYIKTRLVDEGGDWETGEWKINDFLSISKIEE